jgi:hypothetical protein
MVSFSIGIIQANLVQKCQRLVVALQQIPECWPIMSSSHLPEGFQILSYPMSYGVDNPLKQLLEDIG